MLFRSEIPSTYLVPAGSPIRAIADVDKPGVRIAVSEKSAYELYLSRTIKHAQLFRTKGIDASYDTKEDRASIRRLFERGGCSVDSVSRFWARHGRRFVQVQVSTDDVRTLSKCALTSWSTYELAPKQGEANLLAFRQMAGPAAGKPDAAANWNGSELVAFKLHAPSRIQYQNVRSLQDGQPGDTERGNILTWEQRLADRLAGKTIDMQVEMDATSILYTTIWLFVGAFAAAVLMLVLIIWWTMRRGRLGILPGKT